jgi:glycine/D-amino acid oxidase-like deaminating enzyme
VRPYWLEEPAPPLPSRSLEGPVDLAVVGAGITGCSAALHLARAGARVRVVDEREVAGGASGRNGGFALRGCAAPYDVNVATVGRDSARAIWEWTQDAEREMAALGGDAFRPTGSLRVAVDAEERDEIRAEYEALVADGLPVEWREITDGPFAARSHGAIFHPTDGVLQPARFVRRLAAHAVEAGAEIVTGRCVASLDELDAAHVLVCTDGYPSGLLGDLEGLIVPTRGQVIATEPIGERWYEIPHYGRHGFDYWHQTPEGRIVAGGFRDTHLESELTDVEETTPGIQEALTSFVAELAGRPLRVEHRWAGIFGLVLDFLPVVGRVPGSERAWVSGGYSGHGMVLGYACGALAARAVLGERDPLLATFAPARLLGA